MKHAFLIEAHNNWWQMKRLIHQLDDQNHDIYIHIDARSKSFNENDFKNVAQFSTLKFYQVYKVYWGGFSQVQVELLLFKEAHKVGYDYYHVISNADLCLWTPKQIQKFFKENEGLEFIDCNPNAITENHEISRRARLYHFLQNYRRRYKHRLLNKFFTFLERGSLMIQLLLHVNRTRNLNWRIVYGSNWISITNRLVECLLDNEVKIEEVFNYTNCADELFVQTVAWNCGFREKIYQPKVGTANLRLIDWQRGKNGNPYTFHLEDYDFILASGEMFARKFSEQVDKEIIERITI